MAKPKSNWRWVGWGVLGLGALLLLGGLGLWFGVKGEPDFYRQAGVMGGSAGGEQRIQQLTREGEDELVRLKNWAGAVAAAEARAARGATRARTPVEVPTEEFELRLSGEQLTAMLLVWPTLQGWQQQWSQVVEDPVVTTHQGRVVLAGRIKEGTGVPGAAGSVVSLHFRPVVEGNQVRVRLERVMSGRVGLPSGMAMGQLEQLLPSVEQRAAEWRKDGRYDEQRGTVTNPVVFAAVARLVRGIIKDEPFEAVAFVPADERRSVPVWVREVRVEEGQGAGIVIRMKAVDRAERPAVVGRVLGKSAAPGAGR